jgi:hypothetical protein
MGIELNITLDSSSEPIPESSTKSLAISAEEYAPTQ